MKKVLLIAGLLASLTVPAGLFAEGPSALQHYAKQGHRSPEWNDLIEPGFLAYDNKNYPTAFVFFQKAYDRGCRDGLVLYRLSRIYESRKDYKKATELMAEAAPKLKQSYPSLEITKTIDGLLGTMYFQLDDYDKAFPLLDATLKTDPNNFSLLFITGQILRQKKQNDAAYERFSRALKGPIPTGVKPDPRLALLKELMAVTYELKRYDESLKYAEQILAADPKNKLARSYRQTIRNAKSREMQQKQLDEMLKQYK